MDTRVGFFHALAAAHGRLAARLEAELERSVRLSLKETQLLDALSGAEGGARRMNDLSDLVAMSPSGLSRLTDRLEQEGLVQRRTCPTDQRGFFVLLTDAGRERQRAAHQRLAEILEAALPGTDAESLEQMARTLERI